LTNSEVVHYHFARKAHGQVSCVIPGKGLCWLAFM